jgi:hypothetical protein
MRTVSFKSVIDGAIARMGMDSTIAPAGNTLAAFTEYVNSGMRHAWEMYPWPELTRFERRQFYDNWIVSKSYLANDIVLADDGGYYYAIQANVGHDPVTDVNAVWWSSVGNFQSSTGGGVLFAVPLDQTTNGVAQTPIGEVISVFNVDPRVNRFSNRINWFLTNDGVVIGQPSTTYTAIPSAVWLQFTLRPQIYTTSSYTNSDTVPYVLAEAVKMMTTASAQREDGQYDKAENLEAHAAELLAVEFDKLEMKQSQQGRFQALNR